MTKFPLSGFRGKDLSRIAAFTGLRSSGTKSSLVTRLPHELRRQLFGNGKQRILSVDMGLRNLAFCLVEVNTSHIVAPCPSPAAWKPIANVPVKSKHKALAGPELVMDTLFSGNVAQGNLLSAVQLCDWQHIDLVQGAMEADELYDPPTLAPVVYNLVKHTLLPLRPDHVIIERQRHRSGGQAAILEWTFRVNMLESMLWSSLETLRLSSESELGNLLQTHSVLPGRVNTLLLDEGDRKAAEAKVLKTAMANAWLRSGQLTCHGPRAEQMKNEFLTAYKTGSKVASKRQVKAATKAHMSAHDDAQEGGEEKQRKMPLLQAKKLDDLADCLLQAVAWIQWELNRRNILAGINTDG